MILTTLSRVELMEKVSVPNYFSFCLQDLDLTHRENN